MKYRKEKDTMGTVLVPETAYYGPQTQRAAENFPIGDLKLPASFIRALALVKKCAAQVNRELGLLDSKPADAIAAAAREIVDGKFGDQFVVNVFQTGSGTSTNMNMNEVIASRANTSNRSPSLGASAMVISSVGRRGSTRRCTRPRRSPPPPAWARPCHPRCDSPTGVAATLSSWRCALVSSQA